MKLERQIDRTAMGLVVVILTLLLSTMIWFTRDRIQHNAELLHLPTVVAIIYVFVMFIAIGVINGLSQFQAKTDLFKSEVRTTLLWMSNFLVFKFDSVRSMMIAHLYFVVSLICIFIWFKAKAKWQPKKIGN